MLKTSFESLKDPSEHGHKDASETRENDSLSHLIAGRQVKAREILPAVVDRTEKQVLFCG